ncbi:hypothetical protein ETI10_01645 [Macrococcoides goetzii]|nr:hypothetical protein [Macrococcus goetzii]TDM41817.1 hypothetical protein ETI10_01645 [Macrococcus goetzii]
MIKVGDKFNLNNKNWEVILIDNDAVVVARSENGEEGIVSQRTIYKSWYEQQKHRADRAEKRWDTLRRKLKYEYDTANNRTELRCFGMSLDIMQQLEEDGE